jgi:hypothetical protein
VLCNSRNEWHLIALLEKIEAERDALKAAIERTNAELDDERAAKKIAADAADRFRDVLSEALGRPDENPGDDVLVAELRQHFGLNGPEPTRWREFVTGAKAVVDQINAEHRAASNAPQTPTSSADNEARPTNPAAHATTQEAAMSTPSVLARYLTVGGATVDLTPSGSAAVHAECTGCGDGDRFTYGVGIGMTQDEERNEALQSARPWAQQHAERCRAMPLNA